MAEAAPYAYVGGELEIFALAQHWKGYVMQAIGPAIAGTVAEVGAGLGATTKALCNPLEPHAWLCIEPDQTMSEQLERLRADGDLPERCEIFRGVLADTPAYRRFDTILYIDVLEHIEDDRRELAEAAARLETGGRIVVLGPAWQHLYSPFDRAIGHYRRYSVRSLAAIGPHGLKRETAFYMDCVGYFASLANKIILKQSAVRQSQVLLWDRRMVPLSRVLDPIVLRKFGRTVVTIWRKL